VQGQPVGDLQPLHRTLFCAPCFAAILVVVWRQRVRKQRARKLGRGAPAWASKARTAGVLPRGAMQTNPVFGAARVAGRPRPGRPPGSTTAAVNPVFAALARSPARIAGAPPTAGVPRPAPRVMRRAPASGAAQPPTMVAMTNNPMYAAAPPQLSPPAPAAAPTRAVPPAQPQAGPGGSFSTPNPMRAPPPPSPATRPPVKTIVVAAAPLSPRATSSRFAAQVVAQQPPAAEASGTPKPPQSSAASSGGPGPPAAFSGSNVRPVVPGSKPSFVVLSKHRVLKQG
jgi:hypothetical protein